MSDTISLSLWYPQLRLASLQEKLEIVLQQFAAHGGEPGVFSATAWPVNWREAHAFQEVYGLGEHGARIDFAVAEALELLHQKTNMPYPMLVDAQLKVLTSYTNFLKATHQKSMAKQMENEITRLKDEQTPVCKNCTVNVMTLAAR